MRKAASHWKGQHAKLKEQMDAATAASAAVPAPSGSVDATLAAAEAEGKLAAAEARAAEAEGKVTAAETMAAEAEGKMAEAEARAAEAEGKVAEAERKAAAVETKAEAAAAGEAGTDTAAVVAELAELKAKVAAAEEATDKMRKAASHWKGQHAKLKEQMDAATAASAVTPSGSSASPEDVSTGASLPAQDSGTDALAAAQTRLQEMESEKSSIAEQLEKFRKAAHFWKKQHDLLKEPKV